MRDYNRNSGGDRGGRRFDNRGGGGGRRFDNRGSDRQMHDTICANCGKNCQVPFRPTGEKPVYCRECFSDNGGGNDRRSHDRGNRSSNRSSGQSSGPNYQKEFDALNKKLETILDIVLNMKKAMKNEAPALIEEVVMDEGEEGENEEVDFS